MADRCRTYEGDDEAVCRAWIEDVLGRGLEGESLHACLKSGVALCELLKVLNPAAKMKVSTSSFPFPQRENIKVRPERDGAHNRGRRRRTTADRPRSPPRDPKAFIDGCREIGLKEQYNFGTEDLFEEKNMRQVRQTNNDSAPQLTHSLTHSLAHSLARSLAR